MTDGLTQEEFIKKIQTGKGDRQVFSNKNDFIDLGKVLGEITPAATADTPLQITKANYESAALNPDNRDIGWN